MSEGHAQTRSPSEEPSEDDGPRPGPRGGGLSPLQHTTLSEEEDEDEAEREAEVCESSSQGGEQVVVTCASRSSRSSSSDSLYDYDYRGHDGLLLSSPEGSSEEEGDTYLAEPPPSPSRLLSSSLRLAAARRRSSNKRRSLPGLFLVGGRGVGKRALQDLFERLATRYNINVPIRVVENGALAIAGPGDELLPQDVVVLVVDVTDTDALAASLPPAALALQHHHKTVLLGNKVDLEYWRTLAAEEALEFCAARRWFYAEVSALSGLHVKEVFLGVSQLLDPSLGGVLHRAVAAEQARRSRARSDSLSLSASNGSIEAHHNPGGGGTAPSTPNTKQQQVQVGAFFFGGQSGADRAITASTHHQQQRHDGRARAGSLDHSHHAALTEIPLHGADPLGESLSGKAGGDVRRGSKVVLGGFTISDLNPPSPHRHSRDLLGLGAASHVLAALEEKKAALVPGGSRGGATTTTCYDVALAALQPDLADELDESGPSASHVFLQHPPSPQKQQQHDKGVRRPSKLKQATDETAASPVARPRSPQATLTDSKGSSSNFLSQLRTSLSNTALASLAFATTAASKAAAVVSAADAQQQAARPPVAKIRTRPVTVRRLAEDKKDPQQQQQQQQASSKAGPATRSSKAAAVAVVPPTSKAPSVKPHRALDGDKMKQKAEEEGEAVRVKDRRRGWWALTASRLPRGVSCGQVAMLWASEAATEDLEVVVRALARGVDKLLPTLAHSDRGSSSSPSLWRVVLDVLLRPWLLALAHVLVLAGLLCLVLPAVLTMQLFLPSPTTAVPASSSKVSRLEPRPSPPPTSTALCWLRVALRGLPMALLLLAGPAAILLVPPSSQQSQAAVAGYLSVLLLLQGLAVARSYSAWKARRLRVPPAPVLPKLSDKSSCPEQQGPACSHVGSGGGGEATARLLPRGLLSWLLPGVRRRKAEPVVVNSDTTSTSSKRAASPGETEASGVGPVVQPDPPGSFDWSRPENLALLASLGLELVQMASLPLQHDPFRRLSLATASSWPVRLFQAATLGFLPGTASAVWAGLAAVGLVLLLVTHQAVVELRRYGRQLRGPNRDRTKLSHSQGLLGSMARPLTEMGGAHVPRAWRAVVVLLMDSLLLLVVLRLLEGLGFYPGQAAVLPTLGLVVPVLCLYGLAWYLALAVTLTPCLLQPDPAAPAGSGGPQASFSAPYTALQNLAKCKVLVAIALTPAPYRPITTAAACLLAFLPLAALTMAWFMRSSRPRHYSEEWQPCSVALVNLCKAATYGAAALSALTVGCSLVANGPAPTPLLLLAVLLPLWTGLFLSLAVVGLLWRRWTRWHRELVAQLVSLPYNLLAEAWDRDRVVQDLDFEPATVPGFACCRWCELQQEVKEGRRMEWAGTKVEQHLRMIQQPWQQPLT